MKKILEKAAHALRETFLLFSKNLFSNMMSLLSITLVFLFLAVLIIGWRTTTHWVSILRSGAEIQIFEQYSANEGVDNKDIETTPVYTENEVLKKAIAQIPGVLQVNYISAEAAESRMQSLMGESDILTQLGRNPFVPFYEAQIDLSAVDAILQAAEKLPNVERVRDNRAILDQILKIDQAIKTLGIGVGIGVAIFTLVLLSHIIRTGVEMNREQIKTLRLLGAPEGHIAMPFYLLGLVLSLGGVCLATALTGGFLNLAWQNLASPLPFLPLPPLTVIQSQLFFILFGIGLFLGLLGTFSGLNIAGRYEPQ